jgi:hypothetical protein
MAKVTRKLWGGAIEYEDDDAPSDVRAFNSFGKSEALWSYQSRELCRAGVIRDEGKRKEVERNYSSTLSPNRAYAGSLCDRNAA